MSLISSKKLKKSHLEATYDNIVFFSNSLTILNSILECELSQILEHFSFCGRTDGSKLLIADNPVGQDIFISFMIWPFFEIRD